jgi:hypothetical protein
MIRLNGRELQLLLEIMVLMRPFFYRDFWRWFAET